MESFAVARKDAYGLLPDPSTRGVYGLDAGYTNAVVQDVRLQLSRARVRLPVVLNTGRSARGDRTVIADQAKGAA